MAQGPASCTLKPASREQNLAQQARGQKMAAALHLILRTGV